MNQQAPANTSRTQRRNLLGDIPRLPLRVAVQVAWTSIRVRMSRSLVTVSSVILAVAFLLVVLGENVCVRAMHRVYAVDVASVDGAQTLRDVLDRRRSALVMLALLARDPAETGRWAEAQLARPLPTIEPAAAAAAVELADWLRRLSPSQSYLLQRNRNATEWLLAFETPDQVDALIATAKQFKGLRLDIPRERLLVVATAMPALRTTLTALDDAERARLERVAGAGGTEAVLERVRSGAADDALDAAGLPLRQVLPALDAAGRQAVVRQLALDRARAGAAEAIAKLNARDPSLLEARDVDWLGLRDALTKPGMPLATNLAKASDTPLEDLIAQSKAATVGDDAKVMEGERAVLLARINRALADPRMSSREAWPGLTLSAGSTALIKRAKLGERERTSLNRTILATVAPGVVPAGAAPLPLDLRQLGAGTLATHPRASEAVPAITTATGDVGIDALASELRRRAGLSELGATFSAIGFDPNASDRRTFWLVVLSLLVCIVGIVNTMMMAVTERFREIATMKCLGAMDSFILKSFLIESGAMGAVGAMLGAVIGVLVVLLQASGRFGEVFWSALPITPLAGAAGFALICGLALSILGALLPALKAARMHPIEAMRVDA